MKISLITATYNGAEKLPHTINSIRSQLFPDLEYIIIDGGSTDSTLQIINENKDIVSRLISEPDQGISDAYNKGIRLASGEIVGIVSSDDYLLPGALAAVAEAASQHPEADVIYGNSVFVEPGNSKQFIVRPDPDFSKIWQRQPVKHSAMFVRKSAYNKFGLYDLRYMCAMDYELVLRYFLKSAKFLYLDYPLEAFQSGGVNNQKFIVTFREVREISIHYGYSPFKAYPLFWLKCVKSTIKNILMNKWGRQLINSYRKRSKRFQEYTLTR